MTTEAADVLDRARASAYGLSTEVWSIVRKLTGKDNEMYSVCLENAADTVESLRSRLNHHPGLAQLRNLDSSTLDQWILAASDQLDDLRELLASWQCKNNFTTLLEPSSESRKIFDERFKRLQRHSDALDVALKAIDGSNPKAAMKALGDVSRLIDNTEGLEFWIQNFGTNIYQVDFREFRNKMSIKFPALSEQAFTQLKASVDSTNSGVVTIRKWGAFLEGFGPEITTAINKLGETLGEDYFAGFLNSAETVEVLRNCSPGAYLIRFSTKYPCGLILARKVKPGESENPAGVVQTVIISGRGRFEMDGRTFGSLQEIVQSNPSELRFAAPAVKSVARAKFFKGFLSKEETVALLEKEPSGTFLFRFSNGEPGALVVGYKVGNKVHQTRVFSDPERGGYRLQGANEVYAQIEDIVRRNNVELRFPLGSSSADPPLFVGQDRNYAAVYDRYGGVDSALSRWPSGVPPLIPQSHGAHSSYGVIDRLL